MYRASASRACARASSWNVWQSAFTVGSTSSARAITASSSSTGERSCERNRAIASVADR